jgi:hypothetical protein
MSAAMWLPMLNHTFVFPAFDQVNPVMLAQPGTKLVVANRTSHLFVSQNALNSVCQCGKLHVQDAARHGAAVNVSVNNNGSAAIAPSYNVLGSIVLVDAINELQVMAAATPQVTQTG